MLRRSSGGLLWFVRSFLPTPGLVPTAVASLQQFIHRFPFRDGRTSAVLPSR